MQCLSFFFSNVIEYNWCHRFMQNRKELTYRCYKTTKGVFLESGSICGLKLQTFVLLNIHRGDKEKCM